MILGYTDPSEYDELITYDVRPAMYDKAECAILSDDAVKKGTKAKIHIKMDTGMSRIGFQCDDAGINDIVEIAHMPGIEVREYLHIIQRRTNTIKQLQMDSLRYSGL